MGFPWRIGMKKVLFTALITAFVMTAGVAYARMAPPKHPNLLAAQVDLGHAWDTEGQGLHRSGQQGNQAGHRSRQQVSLARDRPEPGRPIGWPGSNLARA
jgi:hypothetical protein